MKAPLNMEGTNFCHTEKCFLLIARVMASEQVVEEVVRTRENLFLVNNQSKYWNI